MQKIPTTLWVVAGAIRDGDGRVLLHRRPPHKQHGGLWEFPGGKVEEGELPRAALVRELAEELGIVCDPVSMHCAGFADEEAASNAPAIVILLYTVVSWTGQPSALESGAEIGWFAADEIASLDMPPLDVKLADAVFAHRTDALTR